MMAASPPRLHSTTPIEIIQAFLARQHQSSENEMQSARKAEQMPLEMAMQEARERFRSKLALENIPLEEAARRPGKIAEEERALTRAKALSEHTTGEAVKRSTAAATARIQALQELYRKDPEAFAAVQRRSAGRPTEAPPVAGQGEEVVALPSSDFDRDELIADMEKRGLYLQRTELYKGKNVGRFGPKATRAWTDPPASRPVDQQPKPPEPAKPTSPQAKDAIPDSGELSPQSRAIGDDIFNRGSGKSDKRSDVNSQTNVAQVNSQTDQGRDVADEDFLIRGLYDALRKNKYGDKGARVMLAHVGRENDFNPQHIFGSHTDPHNRANNVGFFSWQKDRADKVMQELQAAGLVDPSGQIKPSQAALEVMARHSTDEMRQMSPQLLEYLQGDDVDPNRASDALSRRYIKWRHDDPAYASHHKRMQDWYGRVNKSIVPQVRATADPDIFDVLTEDIFGVG